MSKRHSSRYELRLTAELTKNEIPKLGKIYLRKIKDKLKYILRGNDGRKITGNISISIQGELTTDRLDERKQEILEEISKFHHLFTPDFNLDNYENAKILTHEEWLTQIDKRRITKVLGTYIEDIEKYGIIPDDSDSFETIEELYPGYTNLHRHILDTRLKPEDDSAVRLICRYEVKRLYSHLDMNKDPINTYTDENLESEKKPVDYHINQLDESVISLYGYTNKMHVVVVDLSASDDEIQKNLARLLQKNRSEIGPSSRLKSGRSIKSASKSKIDESFFSRLSMLKTLQIIDIDLLSKEKLPDNTICEMLNMTESEYKSGKKVAEFIMSDRGFSILKRYVKANKKFQLNGCDIIVKLCNDPHRSNGFKILNTSPKVVIQTLFNLKSNQDARVFLAKEIEEAIKKKIFHDPKGQELLSKVNISFNLLYTAFENHFSDRMSDNINFSSKISTLDELEPYLKSLIELTQHVQSENVFEQYVCSLEKRELGTFSAILYAKNKGINVSVWKINQNDKNKLDLVAKSDVDSSSALYLLEQNPFALVPLDLLN